MKVKSVEVEGKKYAELDSEGRVLYDNDGAEFAFDAASTYSKIQELQGESKLHREKRQELEQKLAGFEGIDPAKYAEMQDQFKKLDQSKLVDAGEIDKLKAELEKSYKEKYEPELEKARSELDGLKARYNQEKMAASFSGSKYVSDNLNVPPDMALATFGSRFKMEDGKMVAYGEDGPIYSRKNPGNHADFDEALEIIVESYPYRDRILKAANQSGTGGDGGGAGGATRKVTREQFDALSASEKGKMAQAMREGSVVMV